MRLATTTCDFEKFCGTYEEMIKSIHAAGFRYIDLSFYTTSLLDVFLNDDWKNYVQGLKNLADELGMKFVQAHAPNANPLCRDENFDFAVSSTIRSIEVCGMLGIKNLVYHAGWAPEIGQEGHFEKNLEFVKMMIPTMEKCGVNLLAENSAKRNMPNMFYFFDGKTLRDFVDYVGHPLFHACWDTGHANMEGGQYDNILALGKELYALHVQDNSGVWDEHTAPYFGTMNLDDLMHALLDIGYDGFFTFEASNMLWREKREYSTDSRLYRPSLKVQEKAIALLHEIGVYALESYGCYEQ